MRIFLTFLICFSTAVLSAQRDWSQVEITRESLTDRIHVLFGAGGNMGLAIGQEYAYLIDDQFGPLSEKILEAIRGVTDKPLKFVVNTHWHGDHTGGNSNLGRQGAIIIAHDNVRNRMSTPQDRGERGMVQASPFIALPQITFSREMTVHLDSLSSMHIMHVNPSHTDGDSYIYFPEENIMHMGDNFVDGYPYIDLGSGGDIDGFVRNLNMALFIADDQTRIIRGHGAVAERADLEAFRDMVQTIRMRVKQAKKNGKTLEEIQQMGLTAEWDTVYNEGFITSNRLLEAVFKSVD
jgi:glyoxylase-like metal-dependent hydrolase (beta-lactamase superfamily II)